MSSHPKNVPSILVECTFCRLWSKYNIHKNVHIFVCSVQTATRSGFPLLDWVSIVTSPGNRLHQRMWVFIPACNFRKQKLGLITIKTKDTCSPLLFYFRFKKKMGRKNFILHPFRNSNLWRLAVAFEQLLTLIKIQFLSHRRLKNGFV